jgi:hypothetical protein
LCAQTLNKFAKNNELEKIKLFILMGANPDRCVQRRLPPSAAPLFLLVACAAAATVGCRRA